MQHDTTYLDQFDALAQHYCIDLTFSSAGCYAALYHDGTAVVEIRTGTLGATVHAFVEAALALEQAGRIVPEPLEEQA